MLKTALHIAWILMSKNTSMSEMTDRNFTADSTPTLALGYRFQWEPAQDCYVLLYPE